MTVKQTGKYAITVIHTLLAAYPLGPCKAGDGNVLPLHWAAKHQTHVHRFAVVMALLAAHPEATKHKDDEGCFILLHYAAMEQTGERGLTVVRALLEAFPRGATSQELEAACHCTW